MMSGARGNSARVLSRSFSSHRLVAKYVALDASRILAPGLIEWDANGRIVALRRARSAQAREALDVAVLPGLVNAHAHLQIDALPAAERRFLPWVGAVMKAREGVTTAAHRRQAKQSMRELLQSGTTAIGEIDSTGNTTAALRALPMAGRCYREVTGFHLMQREARHLVRERMPDATTSMLPGLSPHAPYSVSPDLMRAAAAATRNLAIHCAEVPEEQQFLRQGTGAFADLLHRLGRMPKDFVAPGCGAVRWLERLGVLRVGTQLVHCQELERGDAGRIAAAGATIAVCPGTIDYFGRTPPPVAQWLRRGIPVALGTDSRASNRGLSMRQELARAAELWPELRLEELFAMATVCGGKALNGPFGSLRRGRRADFVVVPASGSWSETLAGFVRDETPLMAVVLAGVAHRQAARR
jgi:cytosine/adenosine deaminase-related metal-dependent hydrolase